MDTAVAEGVVMVVADRNAGPDFETVQSPGCARQALTVGASDKFDAIAPFSSRGAPGVTSQIKPEVPAPGVSINSTVSTGACFLCDPSGYLALDGTSMAPPHVAGDTALTTLSRGPPPGGTPAGMLYDVLRSRSGSEFTLGATCLGTADGPNVTATDLAVPPAGAGLLLSRAGRQRLIRRHGDPGARIQRRGEDGTRLSLSLPSAIRCGLLHDVRDQGSCISSPPRGVRRSGFPVMGATSQPSDSKQLVTDLQVSECRE